MFTVDPVDGRPLAHRDRGRVRPRRGRRRRPGRARHVRGRQGRSRRSSTAASAPRPSGSCAVPTAETCASRTAPRPRRTRVLTDDQVLALARLALRVEEHYGSPQDTEWAIEGGRDLLRAVAPDHDPRITRRHRHGRDRRGGRRRRRTAGERPGRGAGHRRRARARACATPARATCSSRARSSSRR